MFVEFGTSCLPRHGLYLRHLQQKSFCSCPYGVALFKRDSGERGDVDGEGALVELGQEAAAEREEHRQGYDKQGCRRNYYGARMVEHPE